MILLSYLIVAHLVGDFLLQNEWMQAKSNSHAVCFVHVMNYAIPFFVLFPLGLRPAQLLAILAEHYVQDRYSLHLAWMRFTKKSTPEQWPTGPLCNDQAMHIAFIAAISLT